MLPQADAALVDGQNRTRIFHGVNAVMKIFPWVPNVEVFTLDDSLAEEDWLRLADWGFTAVRLGTMWPGLEWERGVYNTTYLDVLEEIVNGLGKHGIFTLLDAHADLFNRNFCGEFAPDWAVATDGDFLPFPQPIAASIKRNASTGYPELDDCLSRPFFEYYFTHAVSYAYQGLYDNHNGTLDSFFKDNPYVLGYELLNEPWAGDIYADPELLEFGVAGRKNLAPMYEKINAAIRSVDDEHLVFYEDAVSNQGHAGFDAPPGGAAYANRSVYSYHIYCAPTDKSGDPTHVVECNLVDDYFENVKMADVTRLGGGGYLTEMGAMLESPAAADALNHLLDLCDANLQSFNYWQYKPYHDLTTASQPFDESFYYPNGTLQANKIKVLSRTYAYATAGVPRDMMFDAETGAFKFVWDSWGHTIGLPTSIYLNEAMWYPHGYSVTFIPRDGASYSSPTRNHLDIVPASTFPDSSTLTVVITPNDSQVLA
ncbi:endoglycoceramidase [Thecamonas trahens ATCC 50062]|uniref:Endoglycoceramidase n=1 Tax=Thecamonas trahens ATCC 50062 TaxID=461836 RepID=A0A0L0DI98_THETB|nr:endoglycoceramidase [Thecamonas trahens ATCC 50062]KNC51965.1 endoglycoceramidase [Thecamonas trahens ATCC 50062]|eukprot:XP_013755552.1 endoglycoceramidase [Thecamonas trahens ATCC 50062]